MSADDATARWLDEQVDHALANGGALPPELSSSAEFGELGELVQLFASDAAALATEQMSDASGVRRRLLEQVGDEQAAAPGFVGSVLRGTGRSAGWSAGRAWRARRVVMVAGCMVVLCTTLAYADTKSPAGRAIRTAARTLQIPVPAEPKPHHEPAQGADARPGAGERRGDENMGGTGAKPGDERAGDERGSDERGVPVLGPDGEQLLGPDGEPLFRPEGEFKPGDPEFGNGPRPDGQLPPDGDGPRPDGDAGARPPLQPAPGDGEPMAPRPGGSTPPPTQPKPPAGQQPAPGGTMPPPPNGTIQPAPKPGGTAPGSQPPPQQPAPQPAPAPQPRP